MSAWQLHNVPMSDFVNESDIDYDEVFRRGGRNLGDEDFALFRCPSCGRIYLIDYEVDTVYLDGNDLARRADTESNDLRCGTCGYAFVAPIIGPTADSKYWVSWDDLSRSSWVWIARQGN
jgi:hypothetical protein